MSAGGDGGIDRRSACRLGGGVRHRHGRRPGVVLAAVPRRERDADHRHAKRRNDEHHRSDPGVASRPCSRLVSHAGDTTPPRAPAPGGKSRDVPAGFPQVTPRAGSPGGASRSSGRAPRRTRRPRRPSFRPPIETRITLRASSADMPWATSTWLGSASPAGARRAGGDGVALAVEREHEQLGADARDLRQAGDRAAARRPAETTSTPSGERRLEPGAQLRRWSAAVRAAASAAAKPTQPGDVLGARAVAALLPAAPDERRAAGRGRAATRQPTPFGPLQLVRRERHRLDAGADEARPGAMPRPGRRRSGTARPARRARPPPARSTGCTTPVTLFAHMAAASRSPGCTSLRERARVDHPVAADRRPRHLEAAPLELERGLAHGGMLDRAHDQPAQRPAAEAEHGLVVGLGAARGEDDLARLGSRAARRACARAVLERRSGLAAVRVRLRRVAEPLRQIRLHRLASLRAERRRRRVVEVDAHAAVTLGPRPAPEAGRVGHFQDASTALTTASALEVFARR